MMTALRPLSLRKRADFLTLRQGQIVKNRFFILQIKKRSPEGSDARNSDLCTLPRLGFTVSKKNGNAVKRSRIKRRLREAAYQAVDWSCLHGYDCNIIAYRETLNAPFEILLKAFQKAFSSVKK